MPGPGAACAGASMDTGQAPATAAAGSRAHGLDERIRVQSLLDGRRFLYNIVRMYARQPD